MNEKKKKKVGSRTVLRATYMYKAIDLLNPVILVDFSWFHSVETDWYESLQEQ